MNGISELLGNKKDFADDLEITIGDTRHRLGDLRSYAREHEGELEARNTAINQRSAQVDQRLAEAQRAQEEASALFTQLRTIRPEVQYQNNADPLAAYEQDEVMRPFVQYVRQAFQGYGQAIGQLNAALQQSQALSWITHFGNQYNAVLPDLKGVLEKDEAAPTMQDLIKTASSGKLLDEFNVPSVRRAAENFISSRAGKRDLKTTADESYRRGVEETEEKIRKQGAANIPRPGAGGPRNVKTQPVKINRRDPLGGSMDAALQDPEMWRDATVQ